MEDTNTTADTSGSRNKRLCNWSEKVDDRFSNLPDNVYDLIFSYVSFRDWMSLSICSKRLRDFYYSANRSTIESSINADTYNRFLINRGDRKLFHLRICWSVPNIILTSLGMILGHGYVMLCGVTLKIFTFNSLEQNVLSFQAPFKKKSFQAINSHVVSLAVGRCGTWQYVWMVGR